MIIIHKMRANFNFFNLKRAIGLSLACMALCFGSCEDAFQAVQKVDFKVIQINYPRTFKDSLAVSFVQGTKIADPFRWMEKEDDPRLLAWCSAQQSITRQYFDQIPYRMAVFSRLEKLNAYQRIGLPVKCGAAGYWFDQTAPDGQKSLFSSALPQGQPNFQLDAGKLGKAFKNKRIKEWAPSKDGAFIALVIDDAIRIFDVKNTRLLADSIGGRKLQGLKWYRNGFFYCSYPGNVAAAFDFQQLFFHQVGTPMQQDELVYADRARGGLQLFMDISQDEAWLVLKMVHSDSRCSVYIKELGNPQADFIPVVETTKGAIEFAGGQQGALLFASTIGALHGRVLSVSVSNPDQRFWEDLIPQNEAILLKACQIADNIVAAYSLNGAQVLRVFHQNGQLIKELPLPEGTALNAWQPEQHELFLSLGSFTQPDEIARLDMSSLALSIIRSSAIDFASSDYSTDYTLFESQDGIQVPMYIIQKKGLNMDGGRPTVLLGYGAMGHSLQPSFEVMGWPLPALVLENGGIFAIACVRGGGELGEAWHQSGQLKRKQRSFDDFQAAAQYLIQKGYTTSQKLAIVGKGHGALLSAACVSQRPDLYKVAVIADGPQDMLRYHLDQKGAQWVSEYGVPEQTASADNLLSYSPVHNIVAAKYPAIFALSKAFEGADTAPAWHTYKLTAALQDAQQDLAPVLWYDASEQASTQKAANVFAFIWYNFRENVIYPLH